MKKKAISQLFTNFLMWLCVPIVIGIASMINGHTMSSPFPKDAFLKLLEPVQLLTFLSAGVVFYAFMALMRHKNSKQSEQDRAYFFADLGLDEMASTLFSFGSILLTGVLIGATRWYALAAIFCYAIGYYLKPSEQGRKSPTR